MKKSGEKNIRRMKDVEIDFNDSYVDCGLQRMPWRLAEHSDELRTRRATLGARNENPRNLLEALVF
jgi:hypothetical protein